MKLQKCVGSIKTGIVLSRKRKSDPDNAGKSYRVITLRSLTKDGRLNSDEFNSFFSNAELPSTDLAMKNDILVRLSYPNISTLISEELEGLVVPSNFCILKNIIPNIIPEYLVIFLNSDCVQRQFEEGKSQSTVAIIRTSVLRELDIFVPPIHIQKKLIEIERLKLQEIDLLNELVNEKTKMYNAIMKNLVTEYMGGECKN